MYRYFVSYFFVTTCSTGYGNIEITKDLPITGADDVQRMADTIQPHILKDMPATGKILRVVVLNYIQFDQPVLSFSVRYALVHRGTLLPVVTEFYDDDDEDQVLEEPITAPSLEALLDAAADWAVSDRDSIVLGLRPGGEYAHLTIAREEVVVRELSRDDRAEYDRLQAGTDD